MKLVIQIPCCNEEKTLPVTLKSLPRHVEGFDSVEWLVIDDGSDRQRHNPGATPFFRSAGKAGGTGYCQGSKSFDRVSVFLLGYLMLDCYTAMGKIDAFGEDGIILVRLK